MLAYNYPLGGAFLTMLWFFLWVIWIIILFRVIFDIFRSHDMGGWHKALWVIFVIIVPYLGVFVYLIARGSKMHEHAIENAAAAQNAFNQQVRAVAGSGGSVADQLSKLADLKANGTIDDAEFERLKAQAIAG